MINIPQIMATFVGRISDAVDGAAHGVIAESPVLASAPDLIAHSGAFLHSFPICVVTQPQQI